MYVSKCKFYVLYCIFLFFFFDICGKTLRTDTDHQDYMKRESVCRHLLIAVEAIIVSMLFLSCRKEKAEERKSLEEVMSTKIIIPQNIEQIFEGESSCLDSSSRQSAKLLVLLIRYSVENVKCRSFFGFMR